MAAAVRTGECGVCKGTLGTRVDMEVGRLVSSVEGPLRKVLQERFFIRDDPVVCDDCLRKVQPIPRRMGPPWARTKWAERTPERAPLCARGGWDCPGQKLESQSNHTQELLPFNGWSRHLLDKYQIAPYARMERCLCRKCYKEVARSVAGVPESPGTPATPTTPRTPSASAG